MARALLLYNPAARHAPAPDLLREIRGELGLGGFEVETASSSARGHLAELAGRAHEEGVDRVVVCGGDGSIREAAQGLRESPVPLAIVPLGTANVLAQEIGLPSHSPTACAAVAARGRVRAIGLGLVNGESVFTFCASCGLDARAVADVDHAMKTETGAWAYAYSALRGFIGSDLPPFRVELPDGRRFEAAQVFAARASLYGGGNLRLSRQASLFAPHCRLLIISPPLALYLPQALLRLGTSDLEGAPGVVALDAEECLIHCDVPFPVQADGDVAGHTPARLTSRGDQLRLVFPD